MPSFLENFAIWQKNFLKYFDYVKNLTKKLEIMKLKFIGVYLQFFENLSKEQWKISNFRKFS